MPVENDEEPVDGSELKDVSSKKVTAYQSLKRNLSEDELNSSGALKLMLNDLDRLNEELSKLEKFRNDFYNADKEKAVLEEKIHAVTSNEILYTVTVTLGAALLGLCPAIWSLSLEFGLIDLGFSLVLLFVGLVSKFR